MPASIKLKKKLYNYCISERKKRKMLGYKYGNVCVGVEHPSYNIRVCSHSFINPTNYVYYEDIKTKLTAIGEIGKYKKGNCILGYCAEPHAANRLIARLIINRPNNARIDSKNLVFSNALRIRTQQEVNYCSICKQTFNQL